MIITSFRVSTSKNENVDHPPKGTCAIRSIQALAVKLEATHKPAKPPSNHLNHPETSQTIHKSARYQNTTHRPASYEQKISFLCYLKLISIAKPELNLQPFYPITFRFSSEDQSQVRIEGK